MHRVAHLMDQGKHIAQRPLEVQQNEGMHGIAAGGIGAAALAGVLIDIDPALFQPLTDDIAVVLAHGLQRLQDQVAGLLIGEVHEHMKAFQGNCIIQTMFMKGSYQEKDVDNTSDKYVLPWLEVVKEIKPRQVMIYTIDRETPDHDLCKATHEELDRIAALIKEAGILVSVSY